MTVSRFTGMAVLAAAGALAFAGCGSSDKNSGSASSGGGNKSASTKKKTVCAIMPDADSSSRWVHNDSPLLVKQFQAAGFKIVIQNAQGDTNKYATIADQQLTKGCGVMMLVDYNGAAHRR